MGLSIQGDSKSWPISSILWLTNFRWVSVFHAQLRAWLLSRHIRFLKGLRRGWRWSPAMTIRTQFPGMIIEFSCTCLIVIPDSNITDECTAGKHTQMKLVMHLVWMPTDSTCIQDLSGSIGLSYVIRPAAR